MFNALSDFFYSIYEQYSFLSVAALISVLVFLPVGLVLMRRRTNRRARLATELIVHAIPPEKSEVQAVSSILPKTIPEVASLPTAVAHVSERGIPVRAGILIIEDDAIMLLAIKSILAKSGFDLVTARNGKEAFEELAKGHYDIVVTDLMMPYANGLEVVSMIRNDVSKRHVGIIVCSSVGNEDTITEAFRLGADSYIKKPIKTDELLARIRVLLERKMDNPKLVTKKIVKAHV